MASRALFKSNILASVKRAGVRFQSSEATVSAFAAEREAVKHHAAESAETWKKISIFVCIPALLFSGFNAKNLYEKHLEHLAHHAPEFVNYEYMNWRCRDFFWGKESLFFNPKVNHPASEE
ncbi:Cytochrome c oxidase subunit 6A, mitochondrial [Apophysomyces sp. BC1034]|nr:Cytochrome c oxidase subunit 6A, mitochondrial [Apophysomyces sp. BC1015]KAG0183178.1 Cytochrome c oxidase subunit 6A, mitochondrial [Apophysomyces sp. BC1021]KAG0186748.1 Cytochrome c oxidase subunit 6A, mitochondrial [Apophysomyces sp. BC1034]